MSQGTIANILDEMRKKAEPACEAIRKNIEKSEVAGADETNVKVNGKGMWMWVFQTALLTFMFIDLGRAKEIIYKYFPKGLPLTVLVTDRLASYFLMDVKEHQDCLVHLLRNALYLALLLPEEDWPSDFMEFLRECIHEKKVKGASMELYEEKKDKLDGILARETPCGKEEDSDKYAKLESFKKQMVKHSGNILTFLKYDNVPSDNNASERAVRPVKTKMKVSGQFKTTKGAQAYANLHSVTQTAVKNGQNPFLALVAMAKC